MIKAVLFDFDGTIADTNNIILQSWQHTFRTLTGKDGDEETILRTFGEPLVETMRDFFGGSQEEVMEHVEIYRSYQTDIFLEAIDVFPGMIELIKELRSRGFMTALVTSRLKSSTLQGMAKFGLDSLMDGLVTADDTSAHKPDPEPINIMLRKLDIKPEEALMVGDTWMDLACARNAGVKSVLVGWSRALPPEEAVGDKAPDYLIMKAEDLIALV